MERRGGRTVAEVAQSLGIAENLLHSWKRQHDAGMMADHKGIVSNDNTNSTAIKTNVEAARKEVVDLLKIPQGQREDFTGSDK